MFFFCLYILYPILFVSTHSVYKWSTLSNMEFAGLSNYLSLFKDSTFWTTIKNSAVWIVVTVPIQACLGFILAYIIEERLGRKKRNGKGISKMVFRTIFFIPVVTSVTVVAIVWSKIFQPYQGILGYYLSHWFNMSPTINVLGNAKVALLGVMLANIWEWTGWSMIMYVGGLSQISDDIKEAARIDGCSKWQIFWKVIFPLLKPIQATLIILVGVQTFNDFTNPLYFLPGSENTTVQLTLYSYQGQLASSFNLLFADIIVITLPMLVLFVIFNKKIVDGMVAGSVKG